MSDAPIKYRPAPRIATGHLYVLRKPRGISGFQQWDQFNYLVVTADVARFNRTDLLGEYLPVVTDSFFDTCKMEAYADHYAGTDLARVMSPLHLNRVQLATPAAAGGKRRRAPAATLDLGTRVRRLRRLAREAGR